MVLASGHWLDKERKGEVPSPRYGHASALTGNIIFLFRGASNINQEDNPVYFDDFYMLKGTVFSETKSFGRGFVLVGDQVFMFGGHGASGEFCKDLPVLNIEKLVWQKWESKVIEFPAACSGHKLTTHHDKDIYLFGGKSINDDHRVMSSNDIHKFSIAKMKWKVPLYVAIPPARRNGHTPFIVHSHLYIFGGKNEEQEFNDLRVMKLNPSERQPVVKEILSEFGLQGFSHRFSRPHKFPNVRYELSESATIFVHRDFSAVRNKAMSMIQTAFIRLNQEFQGLDHGGQASEPIPRVTQPGGHHPLPRTRGGTPAQLKCPDQSQREGHGYRTTGPHAQSPRPSTPHHHHRPQHLRRAWGPQPPTGPKAGASCHLKKLANHREKRDCPPTTTTDPQNRPEQGTKGGPVQGTAGDGCRHCSQNEAWLRARAEENDRERRELCRLREEMLQEKERLKEEHSSIQKRSQHLLSIMRGLKGCKQIDS
ncbi:uncharacterized protein zmp:0000001301 [Phyllopteryx taeniolatus]|uniref:uncharacterized protein zmp:0000001301 n=1 Tax=Phyllopteryx taeniolatus TaxID=161469 RepID=UPI002AD34958|nr:uncharacterized protein zmp:0000001301 [Phyllopteryx taeniolatus]